MLFLASRDFARDDGTADFLQNFQFQSDSQSRFLGTDKISSSTSINNCFTRDLLRFKRRLLIASSSILDLDSKIRENRRELNTRVREFFDKYLNQMNIKCCTING